MSVSPILSSLLIVILQQYGSMSIDIPFVSFKTVTCWCNAMFFQVVSLYTWYPLLPISAVNEFMSICLNHAPFTVRMFRFFFEFFEFDIRKTLFRML